MPKLRLGRRRLTKHEAFLKAGRKKPTLAYRVQLALWGARFRLASLIAGYDVRGIRYVCPDCEKTWLNVG